MTKTCVHAVGVLGLLCASAAANAAITFTDIYVQQNYYQTGGTTYVDIMSSPLAAITAALGANGPGGNVKISFEVGVVAPADFTSITVSGPGFGSPQALGAPALNEHGEYQADYTDFGFSNLAALNAKYPLGSTYTFMGTASDPLLSQTRTRTYDANYQPTSSPNGPAVVPLLTAASFAGLQGLDASSPYTIAFNAPIFGDDPDEPGIRYFRPRDPERVLRLWQVYRPRPQVCCSRPTLSLRTPCTPFLSATMTEKTGLSSRISRSANSQLPRRPSPSHRRPLWLP